MPQRRSTINRINRAAVSDSSNVLSPEPNFMTKPAEVTKLTIPLPFYSMASKVQSWPSNPLFFEAVFGAYMVAVFFFQFLYIYKTVWWYPQQNPPSSTSLNFHLIDTNLTLLLVLLFVFPFIKACVWDTLKPKDSKMLVVLSWCLLVVVLLIGWSMEVSRNILVLYNTSGLLQLASLCYPLILYLMCCVLMSGNSWSDLKGYLNDTFNKQVQPKTYWRHLQSRYETMAKPEMLEMQDVNAEKVREDIQILCVDFNSRIRHVIVRACFCAYYGSFVPIFFTQKQQSFDTVWSYKHAAIVLLASVVMLCAHLFSSEYLEVLQKTSLLLGKFELCENDGETTAEPDDYKHWSPLAVYFKNDVVVHNNRQYRAVAPHNVAQPGNRTHNRFYKCFIDPTSFLTYPLVIIVLTILYQLYLLAFSYGLWDRLIGTSLMLCFNYGFLFHFLKNRLLMGKDKEFKEYLLDGYVQSEIKKSD